MEGTILALLGLLAAFAWAIHEARLYRAVLRLELPSDTFRRLYRPPSTYRGADNVPQNYTTIMRPIYGSLSASSFSTRDIRYAPGVVWPVGYPDDLMLQRMAAHGRTLD